VIRKVAPPQAFWERITVTLCLQSGAAYLAGKDLIDGKRKKGRKKEEKNTHVAFFCQILSSFLLFSFQFGLIWIDLEHHLHYYYYYHHYYYYHYYQGQQQQQQQQNQDQYHPGHSSIQKIHNVILLWPWQEGST